jgi:hypothetical protein
MMKIKLALGIAVMTAVLVPAASAAPRALPQLFANVGPGSTFTFTNKAGKSVRLIKAGKYTVTAQDRSTTQNFHLIGPGVNIKTTLKGKGSSGWALVLKAGSYRYFSDGSPNTLKGSFRAT